MTSIDTNQTIPAPKPSFSLWNQLEAKQISREELQPTLFKKLGKPVSELQQNLAQELIKKIISYYFAETTEQNYTTYSVVGYVSEIIQRRWKSGPRKGKIYYDLILGGSKEKLKAEPANLKPAQWEQIQKLALLGQNLVFQYRKWITNNQVLDYYPAPKNRKN